MSGALRFYELPTGWYWRDYEPFEDVLVLFEPGNAAGWASITILYGEGDEPDRYHWGWNDGYNKVEGIEPTMGCAMIAAQLHVQTPELKAWNPFSGVE